MVDIIFKSFYMFSLEWFKLKRSDSGIYGRL